jgi:hypothetical protein
MTRLAYWFAAGVAALVVGASGCHQSGGAASLPSSSPSSSPSASPRLAAGHCQAKGSGQYVLPDPSCTPGATNPAVTQANIDQTICTSGWTETVRPPESYTEPLKYQQMAAYGFTGSAGNYEEDHLIPLELGGSPTSPQNLWPESGASPNPKDPVESAANHAVCAGQLTLAAAQRAIATDWIAFGQQLGVARPPTPAPAASSGPSATCAVSASYNSTYRDWDVYVHSNQPSQTITVTTSGGETASYHTDSRGYADVYLHAIAGAGGQRLTVTVGGATCTATL